MADLKVLITGGTGFVGHAIAQELLRSQHEIVLPFRKQHNPQANKQFRQFLHPLETIDGDTNWDNYLNGIDVLCICCYFKFFIWTFGNENSYDC